MLIDGNDGNNIVIQPEYNHCGDVAIYSNHELWIPPTVCFLFKKKKKKKL
jgi:hypothetical protein